MKIYSLEDFTNASWTELFTFVLNTRLPIPPWVLACELISYKTLGSASIVINGFYKLAFIAPYLIAMEIVRSDKKRFILSYAISYLSLFCAAQIHQGNPQGYDVYLPCVLLGFVYIFNLSLEARREHIKILLSLLAGLLLSLAELTRPFMVYLLPLICVVTVARYWGGTTNGRRLGIIFLIPILMLSGSMHAHLFAKHQQITFSNNVGFNLSRAWGRLIVVPELLDESTSRPLAEGRWPNLDTETHQINSDRFKSAVIAQWFNHPVQSVSFALSLLNDFLLGETSIYEYRPNSIFIQTYRLVYKALAMLMLINFCVLLSLLVAKPRHLLVQITDIDNSIILLTTFLIVMFAIGEKGEEARFIISVLPFLCVMPLARTIIFRDDRAVDASSRRRVSFDW
jgi:4-amino-4-deoxy-L-arabinose transferase-like glycosyltransferase